MGMADRSDRIIPSARAVNLPGRQTQQRTAAKVNMVCHRKESLTAFASNISQSGAQRLQATPAASEANVPTSCPAHVSAVNHVGCFAPHSVHTVAVQSAGSHAVG
jgi:hypothetical protein